MGQTTVLGANVDVQVSNDTLLRIVAAIFALILLYFLTRKVFIR